MGTFSMSANWRDLGATESLSQRPVTAVQVESTRLAVVCRDGQFSVLSGVCNHAGGPLGEGSLEGDYLTCPWHYWKFHWRTGLGEPGYEQDAVPAYASKVEGGRLLVDLESRTKRTRLPHPPHALGRKVQRQAGGVRVVAISTTSMTQGQPRFSTSDFLLEIALARAAGSGCETRLIRLRDLKFRHCEGYYSKSAQACTWPCSITQMDANDQLDQVYEAFVHWADVMLIATPIRWGAAGSLYYKMIERMNCIQNQSTIANRELLRNKVAAFIITGGQDNVQAVAGQMLGFFAEVGCVFPQFPYVAHSRGWTAEDMENNVTEVRDSVQLRNGAEALAERSVTMAKTLLRDELPPGDHIRGGRKGHPLTE
jgi:nitrite reductase/ring-hydroxylating ferredoxin subunit/multimeric flavodoxin WrbA